MDVLVIAPHMDDEVLGPGATVARHVQQGDHVTVCITCNRAYDREYDEDAIAQEKDCTRRARKVLGYDDLRFLDLPDERVDDRFQDLLDGLEETVGTAQPEVTYVPYAGDLHQDHRTVAHGANIALRAHAAPSVRRVLAYEVPSATEQTFPDADEGFTPNVYVDVADQFETKLDAMAEYERESRDFPHPRSPQMLTARARKRGAEAGMEAAEAFTLLRETRP